MKKYSSGVRDAAVFLIILLVTLTLQRASGAHSAAFGAEADEASHYVTGVMIRDYIARGLPGNPLTFAKDFYIHYPRVAFGLWPPLFHLLSGVWMLAFGTNRMSIMLLLVAFTTAWAFIFYRISRTAFGTIYAAASAVLLVLLPITQKSTLAVMLDMPLAVMMLLAMAAYARYLERERTADALLFGLCAAIALLVKYNALALAFVPPLCVILTGRHYLWRSKSFWLPAAVVLIIAGPWYLTMRRIAFYAADLGGTHTPTLMKVLAGNVKDMVAVAGPVVFALAIFGGVIIMRVNIGRRLEDSSRKLYSLYVVAAAMVLALFIFHVLIQRYYLRYLLPAAPALILLSRPSLEYLHSFFRNRTALTVAALCLVVALHLACTFRVSLKQTSAYVKAADAVISSGLAHNGAVLVSADAEGEGMLTAEFVMRDRRPDHYVVRASKVLATQNVMGDNYQLKYHTPQQIMMVLDSIPVATVVTQRCPEGKCGEHENLLNEAAALYPERWRLSSVIPSEAASPILVYQIVGNEDKTVKMLQVDLTKTLGTTVDSR
ncbi:MAG TPA: glycosyltransferase family 39 protein [Pyrinomonadaceae bacterium]|nr:glycosyltransferase family 39 protein [Pyrinomonadaceae bacterium]